MTTPEGLLAYNWCGDLVLVFRPWGLNSVLYVSPNRNGRWQRWAAVKDTITYLGAHK